jgi:uncharacterized protein (TIGR03435 family)
VKTIVVLVAAAVILAIQGTAAQSRLAFEVASIRVNAQGGTGKGGVTTPVGTLWRARNTTVRRLIRFAWGSDGDLSTPAELEEHRVVGGPSWIDSEAFDIDARMPDGPRALGDSALMTRTLLAERFALTVHAETRELPAYALVRARDGRVGRPPVGQDTRRCAVRAGVNGLMGNCATTALLARALGARVGRPVIDRTGHADAFDFELRFVQEPSPDSRFPSIFSALEEQLGLKLESTRAPIEVIVVDHVERPTPN